MFITGTPLALQTLVQVEARAFVDVAERARELGCPVPVGIALLPGNFATAASAAELRYHGAAPEVRSAWRRIGLIDDGPDATGPDVPLVAFFGRELRSGPARLVTYALGAVASVLSAHPGQEGASEIRFDAIVERPGRGSYACIDYRGDACELVTLAGKVREILTGSPSLGANDDEGA
jgi:hypothetical protein